MHSKWCLAVIKALERRPVHAENYRMSRIRDVLLPEVCVCVCVYIYIYIYTCHFE